ncbi:MAG: aspartate--tRNA(Asn) ligase [Candidatus Moranbacteria bacterium]|nr:aspartate--tRNA(Asn) ligase [Candidatus Moranbacteria bacterium]
MERTLIGKTPDFIGKKVKISGWVSTRRDHGKLVFMDIRDRSGQIQTIVIPDKEKAHSLAKEIRNEYIVEIEGLVKERPGGSSNEKVDTGGLEIEVENISIISKPKKDLPVDVSEDRMDLNIETLLNHRALVLRNRRIRAIFKVYAEILKSYSEAMRKFGFLEIKSPKILNAATEGGANFFKIKYFERDAFLAQSPQFYKQSGVGAFERVFEVGSVFRAEPHYTTRHINEYVGMDAEMGFIESFEDIMGQLEKVLIAMLKDVKNNCKEELKLYEAEIPEIKTIPRIKLTEALNVLEKEFGKKMDKVDIDPEGERLICQWAKEKYDSDFIFLTHYPSSIRPFYTMPSKDPQYTESFDLLFRGVEIATGGQRIHDYDKLVESIKKHNLDPKDFKHYLDNFLFGMPPHGGWGMGSERIVQKILALDNIKEAVLFPRDVKRLTP